MRRFLYDTNIFVYAVGRDHPLRDPCRRIVELASTDRLAGEASVELLHEYAHVRARSTRDRASAVREAHLIGTLCTLHPVMLSDVRLALTLFDGHPSLEARDAVHAATALNRDIDAILSTDKAFDDVPSLERIDPLEVERLLD